MNHCKLEKNWLEWVTASMHMYTCAFILRKNLEGINNVVNQKGHYNFSLLVIDKKWEGCNTNLTKILAACQWDFEQIFPTLTLYCTLVKSTHGLQRPILSMTRGCLSCTNYVFKGKQIQVFSIFSESCIQDYKDFFRLHRVLNVDLWFLSCLLQVTYPARSLPVMIEF